MQKKTLTLILTMLLISILSGCSRPAPKEEITYNYVTVTDTSSAASTSASEDSPAAITSSSEKTVNSSSGESTLSSVGSSTSAEDSMEFEELMKSISDQTR